ncbi:MAG: phage shock protein operon transcriptional activator [Rhodospirillaceae bacterium]|nr:phage shock protein operon transcriptional activator [Rhodospirillaceae bacterium]
MVDLPAPLGQSTNFLAHIDHLSRVAPVDRPVLIIGERGTGKELSAARIHYLSGRWGGPFVKLNCAALPESLLEAELFGVEAGAFTGAAKRRLGRFEMAHTGSLFLDEIGNAPLSVQEKVLRVIEYGEFERLGGSETLQVSVRVVAATNADLPSEAAAGRFREDLLDRLAFDVLTLPPLRARKGDIELLADHFGRAMANTLDWTSFPGFSASAKAALEAHDWPGNVRELKNVVERAVAHWTAGPAKPISRVVFDPFDSPHRPKSRAAPARQQAAAEDTAPSAAAPKPPTEPVGDFKAAVAEFEHRLLSQALEDCRHNQRLAAKQLGLEYHQLRNALRRNGLLRGRGDANVVAA